MLIQPLWFLANKWLPFPCCQRTITKHFDHAFEPQTSGVVKLSGTLDNKMITITVTDNGKGYDVHQSNETSLGLMIVKSYVKIN